jgi:hypothetical protein
MAMGADCPNMEAWKPTPLGIAQDSSCVSWSKLTALRTQYNTIWEMLNVCSLAEGDKYGEVSLNNKQETDTLPTVIGFFRLTVATNLVEFILTGGDFYERVNDNSYTYLANNFDMVLKDPCNNCSKLRPTSRAAATVEVNCPESGILTLHEGYYALDFDSSPDVCGIDIDWGASRVILEDHVEFFDTVKPASDMAGCHEIIESCCGLYDVGHYEFSGGNYVLKYIDIFMEGDGVTPGMNGYLTSIIQASDLQDIVDRVSSDMSHFLLDEDHLCDQCGLPPTFNIYSDCDDASKNAIDCVSVFVWHSIIGVEAVAGYGFSALTGASNCYTCSNLTLGSGGFLTDGTICTCDWEQLASVMDFLINHGCVKGCAGGVVGTKCRGERDVRISLKYEHQLANSSNCGILNPDDGHYYMKKDVVHTGVNCHCYGSSINFNCDYTETTQQNGSRTAQCGPGYGSDGYCSAIDYSVTPMTAGACEIAHCGTTFNVTCAVGTSVTNWTNQVTKAEVVAAAEGYLGTTGVCSEDTTTDYGEVDLIKCRKAAQSGALSSFAGYGNRSESELGCHIEKSILTVKLTGPDVGLETFTLTWDEVTTPYTGGPSTTVHQSQDLSTSNSYTATITVTATDGFTKVAQNFQIS